MFDAALGAQATAEKQAFKDSEQAATDWKAADSDAQYKQADYDATKQIPKNIDAALKDLKSLLDPASKAEVASDYVGLYFIGQQAKKVADAVQIPSVAELTAWLKTKLTNSEIARETAIGKKAIADSKLAAYNEAKKTYNAAKASRRTDLLKKLKEEPSARNVGAWGCAIEGRVIHEAGFRS